MKYTYKFLTALSAIALLVSACTKDETLQPQLTPAVVGDEILFGARAGFENANPDTRTEYSGETYTDAAGTVFERIDWIDKADGVALYDQIEIASPDAANGPSAHYDVYHLQDADKENDFAYLGKQDESALQWKNDEEHTFYAMYPSSRMFGEESTVAQGVSIDAEGIMHGVIPLSQPGVPSDPKGDGNYVVAPDMRYAYMADKTTATRYAQGTDDQSGAQQGIKLSFVPVVTAVQVQFTLAETDSNGAASQAIKITDLQVEGEGIVGNFTADLASWDRTKSTYPTCAVNGTTTNQITIPLKEAITVNPGKSVTFTVFMMPTANLESLKVKFTSTGVFQAKELTAENATEKNFIKPLCKNHIMNVKLPAQGVKYDLSNWMENLSNNFSMKRLSLPGTGGSFSFNYSGNDADYYAEQHTGSTTAADGTTPAKMDFNAQWEAGIRAFEIVSDRAVTYKYVVIEEAATLYGEQITCNKADVNITVGAAMDQLIAKVKNSDECAVVVFTYQPELSLGSVGVERHVERYAQSLKLWYDGLSNEDKQVFIKYSPSLELGPKKSDSYNTTSDGTYARGNIMILVRLNQKHEADAGTFSAAQTVLADCPVVLIDGCGTAKDRWGARGYKIKVGENEYPMLDQSNSYSSYQTTDGTTYDQNMIIESYMTSNVLGFDTHAKASGDDAYDTYTAEGSNYTVMRPLRDNYNNLNFTFETDDPNVVVWYQEWQRVSNGNATANPYWFESYQEKLSNAEQTFIKAINDSDGNIIYINSLCGFFISGTPSDSGALSTGSTYGGSGGDIAGLANAINPAFSQIVNESGFEQTTGPTGIILMDRVTSGMEVIGKIISNNYKFTLAD